MVKTGPEEWQFAKKATGFMTNSARLAAALNVKCGGDHEHVTLMGPKASRASRYPEKLCDAICQGLREHLAHEQAARQEHAADLDYYQQCAGDESSAFQGVDTAS